MFTYEYVYEMLFSTHIPLHRETARQWRGSAGQKLIVL